jgi:hypothetical protein
VTPLHDAGPGSRAGQLSRLLYVDDSGSERSGLIVYGWVEVQPAEWSDALRTWLELRKDLVRAYGIPVRHELHCTKYVNGRARVSVDPPPRFREGDRVLWKDLGREVAVRCLAALAGSVHLRVGAVFRRVPDRGAAYGRAKYLTYADFVADLDTELRGAGTFGLVTMDGDDPHYRDAHRRLRLRDRHIIEDPVPHDSRVSQWTQMADLVAYCANLTLDRYAGNAFGWDWYGRYLAHLDPHGGPRELVRTQLDPPGPRAWGGSALPG